MIRPRIRRLFSLPSWFRASPGDDVDDEIDSHLELRTEQLVLSGMTRAAAEAEARRRFGEFEAARSRLHDAAAARDRALSFGDRLESLWFDVRYALRGLARRPVFLVGVTLALALGVGANVAVFRVLDRLLLRGPAGVRNVENLSYIQIFPANNSEGNRVFRGSWSYPQVRALASASSIRELAVYTQPRLDTLESGREFAHSTIGRGYMEIAGALPLMGRFFTEDELRPLAGIRSVVISHELWQREFGSDAAAIGKLLTLGGASYEIVGVAPRNFRGIELNPTDAWLPLGAGRFGRMLVNGVEIPWPEVRQTFPFSVVGRLRDGVNREAARAEAAAILSRVERAEGIGPFAAGANVQVRTFGELQRSRMGTGVDILGRVAVVAGLILLLACANTTNLLLLRGQQRRREIAIRLAMGISRWRLTRQVLTESVALTALACSIAAVASFWVATSVRRLLFAEARWEDHVGDGRTLGVAALIAVAVTIAISVAPALQAQGTDIGAMLKQADGRAGKRGRMRNSLVAFQAALSLVLVIGTGLFVRSLGRLNAVDLGLEPSTLIAVRLDDFGSASRRGAPARPGTLDLETVDDLERTIRSWPDVERVAQATLPPFGATRSVSLVVPGVEEVEVPGEPSPVITGVTGEYFATIGTRAITGRLLGTGDTRDAPYVVVVSRSLAAHLWNGDAMGKCMKVGDGLAPCSTVVGVVEDFRENPTAEGGLKRYFVPQEQVATSGSLSTVVLRARTRADVPKIEQRLESVRVQGSRPIVDVVARRVDRHLKLWRTGLALFGVLGAIALTLSAVGLGSVLMASVSERTHEIGVRVALGASRPAVIGMVLRSGMTLVAIGLAIGLAVATAGARLMSAVVFGVSVFDGPVYAVSALTLIVVGLAAAVLPSVRAVRVDPVRTLRED